MKEVEVYKSDFRLDNYLIKESSLKIKGEIEKDNTLSIDINPSGIKRKDKFTLTLELEVKDEKELFYAKLIIDAYFLFRESIPMERLGAFFTMNAPAIIFPYIRGYISMLTSLSGCGTVLLPTLNLTSMGEKLAQNIKEVKE